LSSKTAKAVTVNSGSAVGTTDWTKHAEDFLWVRETIESIVVAFLLAFLFRTFEAEPFVIPTGSMAPTLLGAHKDIFGEKSGYRTQGNVSHEFPEVSSPGSAPSFVVGVVDPISRFPEAIDKYQHPNHDSFCGDRILVSKFIYDFTEPQRWDVIVFKYPGDAKINYIKRLIGLPNETIRIMGGNIWAKPRSADESEFRIQRKPDARLLSMLQVVDDTDYVAADLQKVAWPSKWQSWTPGQPITADRSCADDKNGLKASASADTVSWLRYYQILPTPQDWHAIHTGKGKPAGVNARVAEPITDFTAYNATYDTADRNIPAMSRTEYRQYMSKKQPSSMYLDRNGEPIDLYVEKQGLYWVGDLAIEVEAKVESDTGTLLLDLVRDGEHFQCAVDLATGVATLSRGNGEFAGDGIEAKVKNPTAKTALKGKGRYQIRFSNVDQELRLWVQGRRVAFDGPTTYSVANEKPQPHFEADDPLDLAPVGIGAQGAEIAVTRAKVLRDIYYIAGTGAVSEYGNPNADDARRILLDPASWATTDQFKDMSYFDMETRPDQFLPMGDNSAQSMDGRYWDGRYVDRHLLVGKALLVYWTHPWTRPPFWPEFGRIRFIR
jgi:signal peptidase I